MQGKRGFLPAMLRLLMASLSIVYCAGLTIYLLPFRFGLRKRSRLKCPVISIGNLTTGGTGKTPFTIMLCRSLQSMGKSIVVLNRGYRGKNEFGCAVVSDQNGVLLTSDEAGDEAYLLAKSLPGIPIITGKDRRITGRKATELFNPDVVILDDGMQFWQLHRDLDIVLLNAAAPFDNGWTLPRGLLREPPSHLDRAGIVIVTSGSSCSEEAKAAILKRINELAPGRPIYFTNLIAAGLVDLKNDTQLPLSWLDTRKVSLFSAIGNPASFEQTIQQLGADTIKHTRLRDHEQVSMMELTRICEQAADAGSSALITTAKDAVKIPKIVSAIPVLALEVEMEVSDTQSFLQKLLEKVDALQ